MRSGHFGIRLRLLLGLGLMAAFTLGASLIGINGFQILRQDVTGLVSEEIPTLTLAANLAHTSLAIRADSHSLVVIDDSFEHDGALFRINNQLDQLSIIIANLTSRPVADGDIRQLVDIKDNLEVNIETLNGLIESKLAGSTLRAGHLAQTKALQDNAWHLTQRWSMLQMDTDASEPATDGATQSWLAGIGFALSLLNSALATDEPRAFDTVRRRLETALIESRALIDTLPVARQTEARALQEDIAALGGGDTGIVPQRLRQLRTENAIGSALERALIFSDALAQHGLRIAESLEEAAVHKATLIANEIASRSGFLVWLSAACVLAVLIIFSYMNHSILHRLKRLQKAMRSYVDGQPAEIPSGGTDEITDMSGSLRFFVDDIRRREAALKASERRLQTIVGSVPLAMVICRRSDHVMLYVNEPASELLGLAHDAIANACPLPKFFADAEQQSRFLVDLTNSENVGDQEAEIRHPDGTPVWALISVSPIVFDERHAVFIVLKDITERKRAEQEIKAANACAEAALKNQRIAQDSLIQSEKLASLGTLVASVAHEINTPIGVGLTAVTALAKSTRSIQDKFAVGEMKRSDLEEFLVDAREASGLLVHNINRAAELVTSLNKVAIDSASTDRRRFNLRDHLNDVVRSLQPWLKTAALKVQVDCPEEIEVDTFPGALLQILANLTSNSLLHAYEPGESGQLTIGVYQTDDDTLMLCYADDGKGMPEAVRKKVFEPFFTTRRNTGGTGLGMHIVFNLVTQTLGGQITLTSAPGAGTSYIIRLPRLAPRLPTAARGAATPSAEAAE